MSFPVDHDVLTFPVLHNGVEIKLLGEAVDHGLRVCVQPTSTGLEGALAACRVRLGPQLAADTVTCLKDHTRHPLGLELCGTDEAAEAAADNDNIDIDLCRLGARTGELVSHV